MSGGLWARGHGVTLRHADESILELPGVRRAALDGVERGYDDELPEAPARLERYAVHAGGEIAGIFGVVRERPVAGAVTVWGVAIAPEHRGHAYGAWALLAAERRLRGDGVEAFYARVLRTNGRGVYFALRCGYAPVHLPEDDGATWFRRNLKPAGRASRKRWAREPEVLTPPAVQPEP